MSPLICLLVVFAVGVLPAFDVAAQSNCVWSKFSNTAIGEGTYSSTFSVDECQSACLSTTGCVSIDFYTFSDCLHYTTKKGKTSHVYYDHYDYDCQDPTVATSSGAQTPTCSWVKFPTTALSGAGAGSIAIVTSLDQCQSACLNTPGCVSIDYYENLLCNHQKTKEGKKFNPGVVHYDYNCPA